MKKTLPFFSYLFHPVFIPVFATLLYLFFTENYFILQQKYLIVIQIAIITIFIPISFYFLLRSLGRIDSVMVSEVSQRKIPLIIQAILLYILISKSITQDTIPILYFFFLGLLVSTFLALIFTYLSVKVSLHMLGMSALTAFVIGLSFHNQTNSVFLVAFIVLMNGFVASSRLAMKAHSATELGLGFFCGLLPQFMFWIFWL